MDLFSFILFFIFFLVITYLPQTTIFFRTLKVSELLPTLIITTFIICMVVFSHNVFKSAQYGFNLWLNVVFPALLPFFIGTELLNSTSVISYAGKFLEPIMKPLFNVPGCGSYALAMGITSGYPVGAKITSDLYENGLCTKSQAERLIAFTNNSGPLFIAGSVAAGMFNNAKVGWLLLLTHYMASISVGLLFRFYKRDVSNNDKKSIYRYNETDKIKLSNFGLKLGEAILKSVNILLIICGFIVLFSVIINILELSGVLQYISKLVASICYLLGLNIFLSHGISTGIFEITNGINQISSLVDVDLFPRLITTAAVLGWGGLSVHCQVASIIAKSGISIKPYILGKALQGIFAGFYTYLILTYTDMINTVSIPIFNGGGVPRMLDNTNMSLRLFISTIAFFFVISVVYKIVQTIIKKWS